MYGCTYKGRKNGRTKETGLKDVKMEWLQLRNVNIYKLN